MNRGSQTETRPQDKGDGNLWVEQFKDWSNWYQLSRLKPEKWTTSEGTFLFKSFPVETTAALTGFFLYKSGKCAFFDGICELFPSNVAMSLFMNLKTSQHNRDTLRYTAYGPELGSCIYLRKKNAVYTVSAVRKQAVPLGMGVREEMGTFGWGFSDIHSSQWGQLWL